MRCRSDAARDYDRLVAAFRVLLDESPDPPPSLAEMRRNGGSPPSPRAFYDAMDEAIAAASAVYDTLCEWRDAGSAVAASPDEASGGAPA